MPHIPDTAHDTHDLELVAAHAAGDAEGPALDQAAALVAACTECAALHHDLRSIAAAMPQLPVPARPRDFRLTPEQAASLRPGGLRGLLAAFSGPGSPSPRRSAPGSPPWASSASSSPRAASPRPGRRAHVTTAAPP